MKKIPLLLFLTAITTFNVSAQRNSYPEGYEEKQTEYPTQKDGYYFLGLGVAGIGYIASRTGNVKNKESWYIGASTLIVAGACLVIFGGKVSDSKCWSGMQGYSPPDKSRNYFLTPVDSGKKDDDNNRKLLIRYSLMQK